MDTYRLTDHETLHVTRREPDLLECEAVYATAGKLPPPHRHPAQKEHFEVLEGRLRTIVEGEERVLAVGETIDIPAGAAHQMGAADGAGARVRWQTMPPLRTEEWWAALSTARERAGGDPPLPVLARAVRAHADVFQLVFPAGLARPVLAVLARVPVGR